MAVLPSWWFGPSSDSPGQLTQVPVEEVDHAAIITFTLLPGGGRLSKSRQRQISLNLDVGGI